MITQAIMLVFYFHCTNVFSEEGNVRLNHKQKNRSEEQKGNKKYTEEKISKYEKGQQGGISMLKNSWKSS